MFRGHSMDVLQLTAWQIIGIRNRIARNLSDLCKLLVTCTIRKHYSFVRPVIDLRFSPKDEA